MNPLIEVLVSILPLKRLFKPLELEITPKDTKNLNDVVGKLVTNINNYLKDKSFSLENPPVTLKEVDALAKQLKTLTGVEVLGNLINNLNRQGVDGVQLGQTINNILTLAQQALPRTTLESKDLPASRTQTTKFLWVLRILDNPLWIFNLMANQSLTNIDVITLRLAYPTLYQAITDALITAVIEQQIPLTRPKKMMLSILLQVPVITPEVLNSYAVSDAGEKQTKPTDINTVPGVK